MGKLMLYGAGRACQSLQAKPADSGSPYCTVHTFKDKTGTSRSSLNASTGSNYASGTMKNLQYFKDLTGTISADTLADFDLDDYDENAISNITYSQTSATGINGITYNITATNNGTSAVSVGSIKFEKQLQYSQTPGEHCLICGYFLDTPVTIEAGATKTFAVNIDCWNY